MGIARFIPSRLRDLLDPYSDLAFNVMAYGAVGDGVTDDTAAIVAADAAASAVGASVYFPAAPYKITTTVKPTTPWRGGGMESYLFQGLTPTRGTRLLWYGAVGGTMLDMSPATGASLALTGVQLENMTLDGRSNTPATGAGYGLRMAGCSQCITRNVFIERTSVKSLYLDAVTDQTYTGLNYVYQCEFDGVYLLPEAGGDGLYLDGLATTNATGVNALNSATVNVGSTARFPASGTAYLAGVAFTYTGVTATSLTGCGNHAATVGGEKVTLAAVDGGLDVAFCTFTNMHITAKNGNALVIQDADDNAFYDIALGVAAGGTGKSLVLKAGHNGHCARANSFFFLHASAGIVAEGTESDTSPSRNNSIYGYSDEDAPPAPSIGTGAQLDIVYQSGARYSYGATVNAQTGTAYSFVLTDAWQVVSLNNGAAVTATIPPNSSVAFPIGAEIRITGLGAGLVTVAPGAGVTINNPPGASLTLARYQVARLVKIGTDTWEVNKGSRPPDGSTLAVNAAGQLSFAAGMSPADLLAPGLSGYGGWACDPVLLNSVAALGADKAQWTRVFVPKGTTITNVIMAMSVIPVGANPTAIRLGVLDSTFKCVAVTADVGTAMKSWVANTPTAVALTAPLGPTAADAIYYIGVWMEGSYGTTQPTYLRTGGQTSGTRLSGAPWLNFQLSAAGADLTVNTTYVPSAAGSPPWVAWT